MPSADTDTFSTEITEASVYAAIADVLDPELDESLVRLGFIDSVQVDGRDVTVTFKLPTYWCSPNFAYLMASDLRDRVQAIAGVRSVRIFLLDHCTEDEVSNGVNTGKTFKEVFPEETEDNLEELRLIFLRKGFLMRQDMLLRALQKAGLDEATLLSLRMADVTVDEVTQRIFITTPRRVVQIERQAHTMQSYLRRATLLGLPHGPQGLLFMDEQGQAIPAGGLQDYLRRSRAVRMNIMFNTVFCTDMFQTRYGSGAGRTLPEGERA
ncbi:MAG: iron-sulfur cluster assembly protein [Ktedonobacteraceae bacterium]|nr:iron-sulfur cluster assembly protein [Ktedonobacteraceae bacterium]